MQERHVVTGAFGYSGKYIAARLLQEGYQVRTLTNSLQRENPFGSRVEAHPFNFDEPQKLVESLRGTAVLYNTYWVRFNHARFQHAVAVENTLKLFEAAKQAGVGRIVHVSITNPSAESHLEYFRGKAVLEQALIESGIPYAILRPTVIFGKEDILINNIAWILRISPVFGVFGDGRYRLQPIYVGDLAVLAVEKGREQHNSITDAIGPETFTYAELVRTISMSIGKNPLIISIPPLLGYLVGVLLSAVMGDVVITREEIAGLMLDLLSTDSPPAGTTRFSAWAREHGDILGRRYSSELARRTNLRQAYERL